MDSMSTVEFYKSILLSVGCIVGDTGEVYINDGSGTPLPLTISGRQLMLPTPEVLREGIGSNRIGFAPAGESIVRKESIVMKRLRDLVSARITYVASEVMERLMGIAADHSKHPLLTPDQSEYLSIIPNVDAKTCTALSNVLDKVDDKGNNQIVRIYVKPNGRIGDTVYKRLAAVSFPIMEAKTQEGHKIFGVNMRKDDKKSILALFDYILPNAGVLGHWNAGSNNMMAPGFQSLMLAYGNVIRQLNSLIELYGNVLGDAPIPLMSEIDWVEAIEEIARHRAAINTLPGNDGELIRDSQTGDTPAVETEQVGTTKVAGVATATQPANKATTEVPGTIRPFARPLTDAKDIKPTALATPAPEVRGFTAPDPLPAATTQPPRDWMDIQRQQQSGYAVGGSAYQQPAPQYAQQYAPPPPPQSPYPPAQPAYQQQPNYASAPPRPTGRMTELPIPPGIQIPYHLSGIRVFVDEYNIPFDQNGTPISTETMAVLGYQMQTNYQPPQSYGNGNYGSAYQQPMSGRQAATLNAQARIQQERNGYPQNPGRTGWI